LYQRYTDPEFLVALAEKKIEANYPAIKKELVSELKEAAPELAEKATRNVVASMAEARQEVKEFVLRRVNKALKSGTEFSAEQFREFVREHRDTIREVYQEIKEVPKETRQAVVKLEKRLEDFLGVDYQTQARQVVGFLESINDKLAYLQQEPDLETAEFLELRMLRILRTLQLREFGKIDVASR
jgi:hypothetical protein